MGFIELGDTVPEPDEVMGAAAVVGSLLLILGFTVLRLGEHAVEATLQSSSTRAHCAVEDGVILHAFGHLVQIRIRYGGAARTGSVPFQMQADVAVALASLCGIRATGDSFTFASSPARRGGAHGRLRRIIWHVQLASLLESGQQATPLQSSFYGSRGQLSAYEDMPPPVRVLYHLDPQLGRQGLCHPFCLTLT